MAASQANSGLHLSRHRPAAPFALSLRGFRCLRIFTRTCYSVSFSRVILVGVVLSPCLRASVKIRWPALRGSVSRFSVLFCTSVFLSLHQSHTVFKLGK